MLGIGTDISTRSHLKTAVDHLILYIKHCSGHFLFLGTLTAESTKTLYFVEISNEQIVFRVLLMMCVLQVFWGKIEMIDAERRLLANALMDLNNQYFALVSESYVLRP